MQIEEREILYTFLGYIVPIVSNFELLQKIQSTRFFVFVVSNDLFDAKPYREIPLFWALRLS